jgi:large subunit ribosomal protein L44
MLKFTAPKKALADTVRKMHRERPVSRLIRETGRMSISPTFVVGVYSGVDKLGEGFGSSLRMAEFRAAEDALLRLYLTRTPPEQVVLPSSTFTSLDTDIYSDVDPSAVEGYSPLPLGEQEVLFASAGRSKILYGGNASRDAVTVSLRS